MRQIKTTVDDETYAEFVRWASVNWPMVPLGVILRCWIIQHITSDQGPIGSDSLPVKDRGSMAVPSPSSTSDLDLVLTPTPKEKERRSRSIRDRGSMAVPNSKCIARLCIARMNELKGGRAMSSDEKTESFQDLIRMVGKRIEGEGATEADFIAVIDDRWRRWKDDPKMRTYFRPATIFSREHFADYLAAVGQPVAQVPMFGRKHTVEEENAAAWERAANDPEYGKGWGR